MKTRILYYKERGQALVMIAIAAVALFGFAALAIDGSMVFSDRRHSQNASDTAVLAAALAKVQKDYKGQQSADWQAAAQALAAENGYIDSDPDTQVLVGLCTSPLSTEDGRTYECQGLPAGANPAHYIHVHIKSVVHLSLAQVLGWKTMINHTDAVSRATEPETTNWYDGYGIAATHEGCWSNNNGEPFDLGGSSTTFVNGAGVLVSAICPGEDTVNVSGNASQLTTTKGVCAPGTTNLPANDEDNLGNPGLQPSCNAPDPDSYTLPSEPKCNNVGEINEVSNGNWVAEPGEYTGTFPINIQGGQANIKLKKGIYCLKDGIKLGAGWDITTDLNGNTVHDPATEGVFFFVSGGDVEFNGGAFAFLHAISSNTNSNWQPEWLNLLMYIPNTADVHITGGSGSVFTGTILAPKSVVTLQGATDNTGGNVTLDAQIIADTVKITGNTDLTIVYNKSNNAVTTTNPGIVLIR